MKHYENIVLHSSPLHDLDVDKVEHSVCENVLLELLVAHENTLVHDGYCGVSEFCNFNMCDRKI